MGLFSRKPDPRETPEEYRTLPGMPEAPEGHYWRVSAVNGFFPHVSLMRKGRRHSQEVESAFSSNFGKEPTERLVVALAREVMEIVALRNFRAEEERRLTGDYR